MHEIFFLEVSEACNYNVSQPSVVSLIVLCGDWLTGWCQPRRDDNSILQKFYRKSIVAIIHFLPVF